MELDKILHNRMFIAKYYKESLSGKSFWLLLPPRNIAIVIPKSWIAQTQPHEKFNEYTLHPWAVKMFKEKMNLISKKKDKMNEKDVTQDDQWEEYHSGSYRILTPEEWKDVKVEMLQGRETRCQSCGKIFESYDINDNFCSSECRVAFNKSF